LTWSAATTLVADADGSGYVFAASIAVTPTNVPYIIDDYTGGVYYLGTQSCGGLCSTPVWIRDGNITATFVGVTPTNDVFAFDNWSGKYWEDDSGDSRFWFVAPTGAWINEPDNNGGCLTSLAQNWFLTGTIAGQPVTTAPIVGTGCDPDQYGDPGIYSQFNGNPWFQLAGRALQTAVFTTPDWGDGSLWAIDAFGQVYAYNAPSNYWVEQPGWGVLSITDHAALANDQSVYVWDDSAPNFLDGQLIAGNWEGPVIGPLPSGVPIAQIAYSDTTKLFSYGVGVGGPSEIWAIDTHGNVWTATTVPR
jgi:hypothetical protein